MSTKEKIVRWSDIDKSKLAPLYRRYPGQCSPQGAFLELHPDSGAIAFGVNGEIGNAVPVDVWNNRALRWTVSERLTTRGLAKIAACPNVEKLVTRIIAGHSVVWDGSNNSGSLTRDAQEASDRLGEVLSEHLWTGAYPDDQVQVWTVGDWMANAAWSLTGREDPEAIIACARGFDVLLEGDIQKYLEERAEERASERAEDAS